MKESRLISRRAWIKKAFVTASAVAVVPFLGEATAQAATPAKVTKAIAHYQNHPNSGKMCCVCKYSIPMGGTAGHGMMGATGPGMMKEGTCQVVQGHVSPRGYCLRYMPI
jgi:hypothetical protein